MKPHTADSAAVRPATHDNVRDVENGPLEKAFAAGLFEGEGCIAITKSLSPRNGKPQYCLVTVVKMSDFEPVRFLHERWQGSLTSGKARANAKPLLKWTASTQVARRFLEDIEPFLLSDRRKAAARLAIEFQAQKRITGRGTTDEYRDVQVRFWEQMRFLNSGWLPGVAA